MYGFASAPVLWSKVRYSREPGAGRGVWRPAMARAIEVEESRTVVPNEKRMRKMTNVTLPLGFPPAARRADCRHGHVNTPNFSWRRIRRFRIVDGRRFANADRAWPAGDHARKGRPPASRKSEDSSDCRAAQYGRASASILRRFRPAPRPRPRPIHSWELRAKVRSARPAETSPSL